MKKIFYFLAIAAMFFSCDDFLTIYPENELGSEEFLSSEKDMEIYANGFLQQYMPDDDGLAFSDQFADVIATRSSTDFLKGDTWRPEDQGNWGSGNSGKWAQLRDANWFLDNISKAKPNVSEAVYNHYEGVGRFWRAYFYYSMVRTFGDVPWYEHELDVNDEEQLYKGRDSREFVMDKVLEDLDFASQYCSTDAKMVASSTRITRWVALAFKARVCLFEGTYRKYHPEINLTSSAQKFLRAAIEACETLMNEGPYRLVTGGNVQTQYRSLFTSEALNTTEVILGVAYKTDLRMHDITWKSFSASYGANWSLTKQFVNQYLMLDGSRFTDQPGYQTVLYNDEFKNRDYRLQQTIISPDYQMKINGVDKKYAPNFTMTLTGYQLMKWAIDDDKHWGMATSANSLPMFRYAEVLLNYAEAKAELGEFDENVWNKTIRPLRERAGVNGAIPAAYDPYLAAYYLNQTTDKWILEIRRERSIELAFEQVRYDDLMRWKLGKLIETPWMGIYISEKGKTYDLNGDGVHDVAVVDAEPPAASKVPGVVYVVAGSNYRLSGGNSGYIEFGFHLNRMWLDKKYLRPIPATALQINPALGQNPGWE
ncbi:MAG: RagB/SusD family nutrient uptake outer membrane protein [Mangrovibacterium sp.]